MPELQPGDRGGEDKPARQHPGGHDLVEQPLFGQDAGGGWRELQVCSHLAELLRPFQQPHRVPGAS
jgi:hypothetical protein